MSDVDADADESSLAIDEQAYRRIRSALMDGAFSPGERLSIRRVAAALETSAMPARTALRRLATEKALDILPSGTAVVPRLSRVAFSQLTLIRLELEPLALRMAAPQVGPAASAQLDVIVQAHDAARESGSPDAAMRQDRAFLFTLYRLAGSPMLMGFIESLWLRRSPLFWEARWALLASGGRTVNRHREILTHLTAGDAEAACSELRAEIQGATDFLLEQICFEGDGEGGRSLSRLSSIGYGSLDAAAKPSRRRAAR